MGVLIPILGMLLIAFVAARRRLASGPPIVWTWRLAGMVSLGVLGAMALPIGVALALRLR